MRTENVESKIRSIVEGMGVRYLFANWAQANVSFDDINEPTIIYLLPTNGTTHYNGATAKDEPQTQLAFVVSSEFDFDGIENDDKVEAMKTLAVRFFHRVAQSGLFEPLPNLLPYRTIYDTMDDNVTGVVYDITLKERKGYNVCEL